GPDRKTAFIRVELYLELARLQLGSVLVTEERDEQLVMQIAIVRVPVDVEPAGVVGFGAPFEYVEPERVVGAANAHMVGHEVQDLAEAGCGERRRHVTVILFGAEFGIEQEMIGDVVAVGAARTGLEVGRSIDVTNPEFGEVRRKSGCILEAKAGMKLQPVGGAGHHRGVSTDQRTDHGPRASPQSPSDHRLRSGTDGNSTGFSERLAD